MREGGAALGAALTSLLREDSERHRNAAGGEWDFRNHIWMTDRPSLNDDALLGDGGSA